MPIPRRTRPAPPPSSEGARGGDMLPPDAMQPDMPGSLWAKITGQAASTNRYSWTEIDEGDTAAFDSGLSEDFAATGTSDEEGSPAREINGLTTVPVGTRVRLWPAGDMQHYLFEYAPAPTTDALADLSYYRHAESSGTLGTYAPGGIITGNAPSSITVGSGTIHAVAILFPRAVTLDRLAVYIATAGAAASTARLAIYDTLPGGADLWPRTRLVDTGTFLIDSTGVKSQTISLTLAAGLYWLCYNASASADVRGTSDVFMWPIFGVNDDLSQNMGLRFAYAYAAFPAAFPAKNASYLARGNFAIPFVRIAS